MLTLRPKLNPPSFPLTLSHPPVLPMWGHESLGVVSHVDRWYTPRPRFLRLKVIPIVHVLCDIINRKSNLTNKLVDTQPDDTPNGTINIYENRKIVWHFKFGYRVLLKSAQSLNYMSFYLMPSLNTFFQQPISNQMLSSRGYKSVQRFSKDK